MQRLEVRGAVRPLWLSLGVKGLIQSFNYILYKKGCVWLKTCIYFIRYRMCSASSTTSHPLVTQGDGHPQTVCAVPAPQTLLFYLLMCPINVKACFVVT